MNKSQSIFSAVFTVIFIAIATIIGAGICGIFLRPVDYFSVILYCCGFIAFAILTSYILPPLSAVLAEVRSLKPSKLTAIEISILFYALGTTAFGLIIAIPLIYISAVKAYDFALTYCFMSVHFVFFIPGLRGLGIGLDRTRRYLGYLPSTGENDSRCLSSAFALIASISMLSINLTMLIFAVNLANNVAEFLAQPLHR